MINNETTQYLPGNNGGENKAQSTMNASVNNQPKDDTLAKVGFAAGGFVAGVASTAAVNVLASKLGHSDEAKAGIEAQKEVKAAPETKKDVEPVHELKKEEEPVQEANKEEKPAAETEKPEENPTLTNAPAAHTNDAAEVREVNPADIPSEQDAIIVTDEGIHVAQVDDEMTFSEAFAEARQQVGPGGVFEWHGKVYGTFYKNEWDQMSGNERAEWQAMVDYNDVRDPEAAQQYAKIIIPEDKTDILADYEIEIAGVGVITTPDGECHEIAVLEDITGDQMVLVDTDCDGEYDLGIHDDNQNGIIERDELYDVSDLGISAQDVKMEFFFCA